MYEKVGFPPVYHSYVPVYSYHSKKKAQIAGALLKKDGVYGIPLKMTEFFDIPLKEDQVFGIPI